MKKEHILDEIRGNAQANGGLPLADSPSTSRRTSRNLTGRADSGRVGMMQFVKLDSNPTKNEARSPKTT
jgi:hypothetical protein